MSYLIFDLIIVIVLIIFAVHGAYRGLILSLCGLLAVVVAFVGAGYAARSLSPMVAQALEPRFAAAIEERLDAEIQDAHSPALPEAGMDADAEGGSPSRASSTSSRIWGSMRIWSTPSTRPWRRG